ncbi:FMN-linked oxidoreductase [Auriculariales sp. MPI-PUGE-AT-0066]|nr:FMN-linked oxidoreductase [Auriculariales sp. MPI-PUGE-AT-0066]
MAEAEATKPTFVVRPGTAPIKAEYRVSSSAPIAIVDDDAAEGDLAGDDDPDGERPAKRARLNNKRGRGKERGANKGRRVTKNTRDEIQLCFAVAKGEPCTHGDKCKYAHDIQGFLDTKPVDLIFPDAARLVSEPPYILPTEDVGVCPVFAEEGICRLGWKCRFLGTHLSKTEDGKPELIRDDAKASVVKERVQELNFVQFDVLKALHRRQYAFPKSKKYLKSIENAGNNRNDPDKDSIRDVAVQDTKSLDPETEKPTPTDPVEASTVSPTVLVSSEKLSDVSAEAQMDTPDVPMRPQEKRRLNWTDKTYLAPLTTVGNLPFRRLCVSLGAEITCGEMGLATSFLQGSREEWSLVRRHPSESIFGIQLCGNKPQTLVQAAETIVNEIGSGLDFVDVNCGCPIDLVFTTGAGSALLDAANKLGKIVVGMSKVLGEIPVTVKLRTGVRDGRNTAHKLIPRLQKEFGAGAVTLHGRTRQQRYSKLADWDYIRECAEALRNGCEEDNLPTIPIFGGGDCYSYEGYRTSLEKSGVDGVMIGRGALIKPWIFTEIAEQREWDISSRERLDLIRRYCEYGLNHFGSDTAGVNTTRRFLCEALSFQYRYVPIGLLERLPGQLNERAPPYRGRDELETLLASDDSRTWVKISEMFLGKAPEDWMFTPKHKSNSYGSEDAQG